jgi:hypothetical protein
MLTREAGQAHCPRPSSVALLPGTTLTERKNLRCVHAATLKAGMTEEATSGINLANW